MSKNKEWEKERHKEGVMALNKEERQRGQCEMRSARQSSDTNCG